MRSGGEALTHPTPTDHTGLLSKHHFKILVLIFLKPPLRLDFFFFSFFNLTLVSTPFRPQQKTV